MKFIEKVESNMKKYSEEIFLHDDTNQKGITYGQMENLAGKVYEYLVQNGLGRDDFVMICLPRGIQPIVSMYGVWKSGCAFVLVEDNYAPERIEFIKNDCGCKLVIGSRLKGPGMHWRFNNGILIAALRAALRSHLLICA